jgi:cytochrome c oxidase subunit 1
MLTSGLAVDSRAYFAMITLHTGAPTCVEVFNWIHTFCSLAIVYYLEVFYVTQFFCYVSPRGVFGLLLPNAGLDVIFHDTFFIVAHFQFVRSLGAVVGAFAGFYFQRTLIVKNLFVFFSSKIIFNHFFVGSFLLFFPLQYIGLFDFREEVNDYRLTCLIIIIFLLL